MIFKYYFLLIAILFFYKSSFGFYASTLNPMIDSNCNTPNIIHINKNNSKFTLSPYNTSSNVCGYMNCSWKVDFSGAEILGIDILKVLINWNIASTRLQSLKVFVCDTEQILFQSDSPQLYEYYTQENQICINFTSTSSYKCDDYLYYWNISFEIIQQNSFQV